MGGVAVVAIAVVAIFWIRRRRARETVLVAAPRDEGYVEVGVNCVGGSEKGDGKGDGEFEAWNERDLRMNGKV